MPLVNMSSMLEKAREGKYAVGQFNINNLEWTKTILETAEKNQSGSRRDEVTGDTRCI